ncbi:MAG: hypothetical protein J5789_07565 [Oscillospiraceae bacterium]|nr:hypothetical protein [Oscillospiraceae bacterium]
MSKFLDSAYINALLDSPASLPKVYAQKTQEVEDRKKLADNQYILAQLLREAMKQPEDDPERLAVVAFLKDLGGIENAK